MKKFIRYAVIALVALFLVLQLLPVARSNPPVTREVQWDSTQTRALAQRACFDCHSNETVWPWYSYIAPISLRVADHVQEGRQKLNFSAWDQPNEDAREIIETIEEGEMPLADYLLVHVEAKLTADEQQSLINGLQATLANDPPQRD